LFAFEAESLLKALTSFTVPPARSRQEQPEPAARSGINDEDLAQLVINLYENDALCLVQEERALGEPQIICSMGLS